MPESIESGFVQARHLALLNFILFALYALTGKLGLMVAAAPSYATAIWPPSGIALGMLLLYGYRLWPGIFLGSFVLNADIAGIFNNIDLILSAKTLIVFAIALGAVLQAVIGRFLLSRFFTFPLTIERPRDALSFLLLSAPLGCLVSASVANTALYLGGVQNDEQSLYSWLTWWMGDSFGVLAFMPITLIVASTLWPAGGQNKRILHSLPPTALLALFISIIITFAAWKGMVESIFEKNRASFVSLADELEKALLYRIDSYEKSLLGGAGFLAGSEDVSRDEWRRYSEWVDIEKNYPGMNGIGYIMPVAKKNLEKYIRAQRAEGLADFDVHSDKDADENFIITYVEPYEKNRQAVGLNIASEKNRYEAAVQARDSGRAAITRRIQLVQDERKMPGFLLLYPIYETGALIQTEAERRQAFKGWIYAPFVARKFMAGLVSRPAHETEIYLDVYDGDTADPRYLIFSSRGLTPETVQEAGGKSMFMIRKVLEVKQQQWTVVWQSAPVLENRMHSNGPLVILFGGMTFTSLLAMFLIVMSRRAELVQQEVDRKTHEIGASEEKMRMLIRHTPAAVAMFDRQMRYIMTSERWLKDYGLRERDIIGRSHYDIFPEILNMPEWLDHHQRCMKGESLSREEDAWVRPDGRTEWVRWELRPWRDSDGYIGGIIMFTEVITEQKRARSELMRSNTALEEFAYVVSHDLKAPVRHMGMCAEFLQEAYGDKFDDEGKRFLGIITDSSLKMRAMIESLLDYARIGSNSGDFRDIDLEKALEIARLNVTALISESGADIQNGRLPTVRGVEGELVRVFQNLLENALKYRKENVSPKIRIDAERSGNVWKITVTDNGIGIDPRFADKVFLLFQRLHGDDSAYAGQGIGLAICQRIVRYHGGQIYLDRDYADGSRFVFTLPDYMETKSSFDEDSHAAKSE
ncbi:MAG: CHASE domain-containing protein [Alphaproteobacteria bacterium]|nr:CHASE domain-containing protein [Alphaproteobacteria bacterium]